MLDPCGPVLTRSFTAASGAFVAGRPDSPDTSGCSTGALAGATCSPPTLTTPGCGCAADTAAPAREGPNTTCEFGECTRTALAHCVGAGCCAGGTPCTHTRHIPPGGAYLGGIAVPDTSWPIGAGGPSPRPVNDRWTAGGSPEPSGATRTAVACAESRAALPSNAQPTAMATARRVPA